ncbi:MAG: hypothetical protein Kow0099_39290 [Candidatus Abyssubacteria bacterium]
MDHEWDEWSRITRSGELPRTDLSADWAGLKGRGQKHNYFDHGFTLQRETRNRFGKIPASFT